MQLRKNASILSIAKYLRIKAARAWVNMENNPRASLQYGIWLDCWNSLHEAACAMERRAGLEEYWYRTSQCSEAKIIRNMRQP